jgi:hypothetical protein
MASGLAPGHNHITANSNHWAGRHGMTLLQNSVSHYNASGGKNVPVAAILTRSRLGERTLRPQHRPSLHRLFSGMIFFAFWLSSVIR